MTESQIKQLLQNDIRQFMLIAQLAFYSDDQIGKGLKMIANHYFEELVKTKCIELKNYLYSGDSYLN